MPQCHYKGNHAVIGMHKSKAWPDISSLWLISPLLIKKLVKICSLTKKPKIIIVFTLQSHYLIFFLLVHFFFFFWFFYVFFFHAYFPSYIVLIFFLFSLQTFPKTIIISLAVQPSDMLILQKEKSPTAQHQQIILCKSSFHHLEPLFYATENHKLMQVKVEMLNLKEFLYMFRMHLGFCVKKMGLFLAMNFSSIL